MHVSIWGQRSGAFNELRQWFHHDAGHWTEFEKRYKAELKESGAVEALLPEIRKHKVVTLLYGARDEQHNQAIVLQELLSRH